jgi:hypothetical protein
MQAQGTRELIAGQAADIRARLDAVRARLDEHAPGIRSRRGAADRCRAVALLAAAADRLLGSGQGAARPGPPGADGLPQGLWDDCAADSLRDALHYLVWAEHDAGLRTEESARSLDPFLQPCGDALPEPPAGPPGRGPEGNPRERRGTPPAAPGGPATGQAAQCTVTDGAA